MGLPIVGHGRGGCFLDSFDPAKDSWPEHHRERGYSDEVNYVPEHQSFPDSAPFSIPFRSRKFVVPGAPVGTA